MKSASFVRVAVGAFLAVTLIVSATMRAERQEGAAAAPQLTPEELLEVLSEPPDDPPDLAVGRTIYQASCGACHLFGALGTGLGPDLTTASSRFRPSDIAEAVIFPSRVVSDQYAMEIVATFAGRIVAGIVQGESAESLYIVTPAAPERPVSIPVSSIESRQVLDTSLMPPGLFEGLSLAEMHSLIAFVLGPAPTEP